MTFRPYWYLAGLRIVLVCVPQLGYIHPDEYFQSVEILAGKFFDIECSPPWEFNSSFPIRSMAIPYFTVGMNYKLLKSINSLTNEYWAMSILTPYFMLIFPRLLMCIFSFIVDYSIYKICINNNEKYKTKLFILGSSYVMLIYATRTFSNTIELILFAILLYYVCESLTFSNILIKKKEYLNYRYEQSSDIAEKAKFHKLRLYLSSDSLRNCMIISTIVVLGFFNRPTFLAFAVFPIFFWVYRGIGSKVVMSMNFYLRIFVFALCTIPSVVLIIVIDSFFYGYLTWGEIGMLDVSINSFVFTPLNFIKYNIDSTNLAIHGLHPRFLHLLVNIPLLFNVLGICAIISLLQYAQRCINLKFHLLPTVRSIKGLMTLSLVAPIALLSVFPHQEPRFLIPVIVPLAYLHGNTILPEIETGVVEAQKVKNPSLKKVKDSSNLLLKLWLFINALLLIFYGFIHQGGVYQATAYISKELKISPLSTEFHVVTSHIYSIPESFFLQKPSNKLYLSGKAKYTHSRRVFLYEEGSQNLTYILDKLQNIVNINEKIRLEKPNKQFKVMLVIPRSLENRLNNLIHTKYLKFVRLETFYPHLSTEAFPDFGSFCLEITAPFYDRNCTVVSYYNYLKQMYSLCGLSLYEITLNSSKS